MVSVEHKLEIALKALKHYDEMYSGAFCAHHGTSGKTMSDSKTSSFDIGDVARKALEEIGKE